AADPQNLRKALHVHLQEAVIPTYPLGEPAAQCARALRAHHEPPVVIDTLAAAEENHGVLEIFRIDRQRVFFQQTLERAAAIDGNAGGNAEVGQALAPDPE